VRRWPALAEAAGFRLPGTDDGRLALRRPLPDTRGLTGDHPYVVVHPGASVPSRAPSPAWAAELVRRLAADGHRVAVTGGPSERALTRAVAGAAGLDLGGATDLAGLADLLDRAGAVVVGNTGPAHLAAAVGTPVVSLYAPVVPAERWRPWRVPSVLLGDQRAECAESRAKDCPVPGHPCLSDVPIVRAVEAVAQLLDPTRSPAQAGPPAGRPALEVSA
jgi:ADP-heptose:LPS heptosyltransferase